MINVFLKTYKKFFIFFISFSNFLFSSENFEINNFPLKYQSSDCDGYITKLFLKNSETNEAFNLYGFLDKIFVDSENGFLIKKNHKDLKISFPQFFNLFFDEKKEVFRMVSLHKNSFSQKFNGYYFSENEELEMFSKFNQSILSNKVTFVSNQFHATQIFNDVLKSRMAAILLDNYEFLTEKIIDNNERELVVETFNHIEMFNNYLFKKYNNKIHNVVRVDFFSDFNPNVFFEGVADINKNEICFSLFGIDLNSIFPISKSVTSESTLLFEYTYSNADKEEFRFNVDDDFNPINASGSFFNISDSKIIKIKFGKILCNELKIKKINIFNKYLTSDVSSTSINLINNFPYKINSTELPLITKIMDKNEILLQSDLFSSGTHFLKPNYIVSADDRNISEKYKIIEINFNCPSKKIKSQKIYAKVDTIKQLNECICSEINNNDNIDKHNLNYYNISFEINGYEPSFVFSDTLNKLFLDEAYSGTEIRRTFLRTTQKFSPVKILNNYDKSNHKIIAKIFHKDDEVIRLENNLFIIKRTKKNINELLENSMSELLYKIEKQDQKIKQLSDQIEVNKIENLIRNEMEDKKNEKYMDIIKKNTDTLIKLLAIVAKKQ